MSGFKDKAYVCNLCRKVITYSPEEAGQTMPCPFCKSSVTLPASSGGHRVGCPGRPHHRGVAGLIVVLLAAGAAAVAWQMLYTRTPGPPAAGSGGAGLSAFNAWVKHPCASDASKPRKARGVDVTVAVTDVRFGCPDIYQTALQRVAPTDTPVCCVRVALTNTGKTAVRIQPWRLFDSLTDAKRACLKRADGNAYSLVSFGVENDPLGAARASELLPDATSCDVILFLCDERPSDDLELTLPCENIGGKGELCFRIPNSMIH